MITINRIIFTVIILVLCIVILFVFIYCIPTIKFLRPVYVILQYTDANKTELYTICGYTFNTESAAAHWAYVSKIPYYKIVKLR